MTLVATQGCGAIPTGTGLQAPDDNPILPATVTDEGEPDGDTVQDTHGDLLSISSADTQVYGKCDVSFYNSDFGYGFDLPLGADLHSFDDEQAFLFNASWILDLGPDVVMLVTRVHDGMESVSLTDYVESLNSGQKANGDEFVIEMPLTLSNGDPADLSVFVAEGDSGYYAVTYRVMTIKHGRMYFVSALESVEDLTASTDALLTETVLSLCVE